MDGFRFWRTGFWKDHLRGKPYHISALYVIDLARFRCALAMFFERACHVKQHVRLSLSCCPIVRSIKRGPQQPGASLDVVDSTRTAAAASCTRRLERLRRLSPPNLTLGLRCHHAGRRRRAISCA